MGFEMGAKADAERYCLVLDARYVQSAPWPPILWPKMDTRVRSCAAPLFQHGWARNASCSRWAVRQFPKLEESRVGCACACCSGERTSDSWRSSRSRPLWKEQSVHRKHVCKLHAECIVPVPKSQSSSSPSIPAPRGDVSVKRIAMPSLAAGPRKLPF